MLNFNPIKAAFDSMRGQKLAGRNVGARESQPQGMWTGTFDNWNPRSVNAQFYEAIREAVPLIDGGINLMTTLDGVLDIEAETSAMEAELKEFAEGVRVNDMQQGLQALYAGSGNEMYEQGHSLAEILPNKAKNDVDRLWLADSKGVYFRRNEAGNIEAWYCPPGKRRSRGDGTDNVERILRNSYGATTPAQLAQYGYRKLDPRILVYAGLNNEADNPYGVSIMRSLEFVSRSILTIENATNQTWARFGDPIFNITYKTNNKALSDNETELSKKRDGFAASLAAALNIKKQGNSADVVNAIGKDDELTIQVLGADGQVLEIEAPMRHFEEQVVGRFGVPAWMMGRHWSTAERLAQRQGELVLMQSRTRFAMRRPGLTRIIETMLRLRGRTWKKGDWRLVQVLPNLQDILAEAQAEFLHAQADMVRSGGGFGSTSGDNAPKVTTTGQVMLPTDDGYTKTLHGHKGEDYVDDGEALGALEAKAERALKKRWGQLLVDTLAVLQLPSKQAKDADDVVAWIFDPTAMRAELEQLADEFMAEAGAHDAALARAMVDAWEIGINRAMAELDVDELALDVRSDAARALAARGMELVRDAITRTYREDIIAMLQAGELDGLNPNDVARLLRQKFVEHNYDWERLARSEIAESQVTGKLTLYAEEGLEQYDWVRAGGACSTCMTLAAGGPYLVGTGPRPMSDSHPNCRCTIVARAPD